MSDIDPQGYKKQTLRPIVTGQSVIAFIYKDGIIMAADTALSYGSQRKFKNAKRLFALKQSNCLLGFSGEYSDVQHIMKMLYAKEFEDFVQDTVCIPKVAPELHRFLTRILYRKRSEFNPLWTQVAIGGFTNNESPYLGYADYHGTFYEDDIVATGFGSYLAIPLLRSKASKTMTKEEAIELLEQCMRVLYARDCYGYNQIQIATVTKDGIEISSPYQIHPNWSLKAYAAKPVDEFSIPSMAW